MSAARKRTSGNRIAYLCGDAWIDRAAYQLVLKFSDVPTIPQAQALIRTLLEERFKLRWHTEKRDLPVYTLVIAGCS